MQNLIDTTINQISNLSFRHWVRIMVTALIAVLLYIIYDLQNKDQLIALISREKGELIENRPVDECLLRIEQDNHILYRTVYHPPLFAYNFINGKDDFWVAYVSQDNENLLTTPPEELREHFFAECSILDSVSDIIKARYPDVDAVRRSVAVPPTDN